MRFTKSFMTLGILAAVVLAGFGMAIAGDHAYVGAKKCKTCHMKQYKSWAETKMAQAFDVLKPGERAEAKTKAGLDTNKDNTADAKCLKCHTTGYGQTGGYPAYKATFDEAEAKLAKNNSGIGCEACHGAGSKYAPYKKDHEDYKRPDVIALGLKLPVSADNCTGCHNSESPTTGDDYVFDFEKAKGNTKAVHDHKPLQNEH